MGAAVEGWSWERIEKEHGTLARLLPYQHYRATSEWVREPGTTEDGVERQKLIILAILSKRDRVTAEDVRRSWLEHMNPKAAGLISEPFEGALLEMARTPMPAADIGKYCDYSGLVSLARSCHPIGLINAGDVPSAIADVHEVGQLYNVAGSRGIRWAEVTVASIAAATTPGATVDAVLGAVFDHCDRAGTRWGKEVGVRQELERGLKMSNDCRDFRDLRVKMDTAYAGRGIPYASSFANEVVTKAICIFKMTGGDTWEAIRSAVNMGRDTDCLAAVAGGISGALSGARSIPEDRLAQVDRATSLNEHTCAKKAVRETADGLFDAYRARLERLRGFVDTMSRA
jgi:ADP-ribosylglycohydrolase